MQIIRIFIVYGFFVVNFVVVIARDKEGAVVFNNPKYVGTPKLSCKDIKFIVDFHNDCRRMLANGSLDGQPKAANMQKVVWDENLAATAANWTKQMVFRHNPYREDSRYFRASVGENLFLTGSTNTRNRRMEWWRPLKAWFQEHRDYKYCPTVNDPLTGHYTQMMWSNIIHIGCGTSHFRERKHWLYKYYVCNYGPGGNWFGEYPYVEDTGYNELQELQESGFEIEGVAPPASNCSNLCCDFNQCELEYGRECSEPYRH